jgi:hypothetical protein
VLAVNSKPAKFMFCELSDLSNNLDIFTNLIRNEYKNGRFIPQLFVNHYFVYFDDKLSPWSLSYLPTFFELDHYSNMISLIKEKGANCVINSLGFNFIPKNSNEFFSYINSNFPNIHTLHFYKYVLSDDELKLLKSGFKVCKNLKQI